MQSKNSFNLLRNKSNFLKTMNETVLILFDDLMLEKQAKIQTSENNRCGPKLCFGIPKQGLGVKNDPKHSFKHSFMKK